ncbi:Uncharacterised protein [Citrobacter koseri]|uniref:Uncharacterized protein n=1 Tax=Citrobacter koseri TaxID=545 RepID=A0A2X2WHB2_CITKO|nr:Uncharacterised protein [Citrobacter koseri]
MDQLNVIFVIDVLFPERRQMNLNGIKVISPFIGIVGRNAVTRNGMGQNNDVITLGIQR